MTQKSTINLYLNTLTPSLRSVLPQTNCSSSAVFPKNYLLKDSKELQNKYKQRPKMYRSFQKLKKRSVDEGILKKNYRMFNQTTLQNRGIQKVDLESNQSKLFKLKEQLTQNPKYFVKKPDASKDIVKIPKFLNKSRQKGSSPSQMAPASPRSGLNSTCQQLKDVSRANLPVTASKFISMRLKGRRQFFKVVGFLDEGSYGKVFLVRHTFTNFLLCLKVIQKAQLSESSLNQLAREIFIQSFVDHPSIVNLYGFSADTEFIYLLLQPCLDGNLYTVIKKKPLEQKIARRYLKQVCNAIEYMHRNNIIHRDIKPENILLHEGSAKICDFGWAIHSSLMRNTLCGTPIYTCPQMVKDQPYDKKMDIWCVGVLAYQMLTNEVPFTIKTPKDFLKIIENDVSFPTGKVVSQQARDFIYRCLQKNADKRYCVQQVLCHLFLTTSPKKLDQ